MIVIGIDPGLSGAIAFLSDERAIVLDLPTVPLEGNGTVTQRVHAPTLASMVRQHCPKGVPIRAVLEDLTAGGQDSSQQTVGSQYRTRGTIEAALEMLGLEVKTVFAQRWKNLYGIGKEKKDSLTLARELYPELVYDLRLAKHHNRAESVLIAHWGKKVL